MYKYIYICTYMYMHICADEHMHRYTRVYTYT